MKKAMTILVSVCLLCCMAGCVSQSDLDAVIAERDALQEERDTLQGERDALQGERDALQAKVGQYSELIDAMEGEEYEHAIEIVTAMMPQPEFEEVHLTEENWFDYFELDILCYSREYNADGSLKHVWLFPTYAIKEEYQERYIQAKDVFCGVNGMYCYMDVLVNEDGSYVFDYDNIIECNSREEIDVSFTKLIFSFGGTERAGFYPEGYMVENSKRGWDIPVGEQQVIVPWNYEIIKCEGTLILKK